MNNSESPVQNSGKSSFDDSKEWCRWAIDAHHKTMVQRHHAGIDGFRRDRDDYVDHVLQDVPEPVKATSWAWLAVGEYGSRVWLHGD